jgi:hypothetical protein
MISLMTKEFVFQKLDDCERNMTNELFEEFPLSEEIFYAHCQDLGFEYQNWKRDIMQTNLT